MKEAIAIDKCKWQAMNRDTGHWILLFVINLRQAPSLRSISLVWK